jgi:Ran GTPase-activating protein (RanGAP) involved in mRNA processing and transport
VVFFFFFFFFFFGFFFFFFFFFFLFFFFFMPRFRDVIALIQRGDFSVTCRDSLSSGFSDAELTQIFESLRVNNTTLVSLDLSAVKVGYSHVHLAQLLPRLSAATALTSLDVSHNAIGMPGAVALAEMLGHDSRLRELRCVSCGFYGRGLATIVSAPAPALTLLRANANLFGVDGIAIAAAAVGKMLRKDGGRLETLGLYNSGCGAAGASTIAAALRANRTLLALDVGSSAIGGDGATSLFHALGGSNNGNSNNSNNSNDGNIKNNSNNDNNNINNTLQSLNLCSNAIGDAPLEALRDALAANTAVTTLNLQRNGITDVGAGFLAQALRGNQTLRELDLRFNQIGAEGSRAIFEALAANRSLTVLGLGNNQTVSAAGATALGEALRVEKCKISDKISDNRSTEIQPQSNARPVLERLSIEGCTLGAAGTAALLQPLRPQHAHRWTLRELNLARNAIKNEGAVCVAEMLGAAHDCCPALETLVLRGNAIGSEGATAIADALVQRARGREGGRVKHPLARLDISYNSIGDAGAVALARVLAGPMTTTTTTSGATPSSETRSGRCCNTGLVNLGITHNSIGKVGARSIAAALASTGASLTRLGMGDNPMIGDDGAEALAAALARNASLLWLSLDGCGVGDAAVASLARGLAQNTTLRFLHVRTLNNADRGTESATLAVPDASVRVPLAATQRLMFFKGHLDRPWARSSIRRLPHEIVARILTAYPVLQGSRQFRREPGFGDWIEVFATQNRGVEMKREVD